MVAAAAVLLCGPFAAAQARRPPAPLAGQVQSLGRQMASPAIDARMAAFYALLRLRAVELPRHPELHAEFNLALIQGLAAENEFERQANAKSAAKIVHPGYEAQPDHPDSAEGNYFGDIIQAVAALNDPRALPVLMDDIQTGNGAMAAVAKFGRRAFAPLSALLQATEPGTAVCLIPVADLCASDERMAALRTLAGIAARPTYVTLKPAQAAELEHQLLLAARTGPLAKRENREFLRTIPPAERLPYIDDAERRATALRGLASIRSAQNDSIVTEHALHDPSPEVRKAAISAMQHWGETSLEPLFRRIMRTDPDAAVREQARVALKALGGAPRPTSTRRSKTPRPGSAATSPITAAPHSPTCGTAPATSPPR
ncbi:MAG TPA: HEAT repeat domain-containing protein [Terriglobales bacterium]|nr:HEAT repeat domain-containing protein [Terriglobales bacterium]